MMKHFGTGNPRSRPPRPFCKSLRARGSAASPHRIAFLHDSRGNCLRALDTSGSAYFAWTSADLVDKIRWADGKANYFYYDARLRRFGMRDSDGLRYFTWDSGGMNLLLERSGAKAQTAAYAHGRTPIPGIGSTVAVKKTEVSTTYYQYPVYDHRGSVVRLLDGAGAVKAYYEYDAFGRPLREEVVGKSAPNRLRWQTNWDCLKDSNGRFYDSPLRVYDSKTGRFLNRNPWGAIQGRYSLYDFAGNNPVSRVEPLSNGIEISNVEEALRAREQGLLSSEEERQLQATIGQAVTEREHWSREPEVPERWTLKVEPPSAPGPRSVREPVGTSSLYLTNLKHLFMLGDLKPPAGRPNETREQCQDRIVKWTAGVIRDIEWSAFAGESAVVAALEQEKYHKAKVRGYERLLGGALGWGSFVLTKSVSGKFESATQAKSESLLGFAAQAGGVSAVRAAVKQGEIRSALAAAVLSEAAGVFAGQFAENPASLDEVVRRILEAKYPGYRLSRELVSPGTHVAAVQQLRKARADAIARVLKIGKNCYDSCGCSIY